LSWCCCRSTHWRISSKTIELDSGFCQGAQVSFNISQIKVCVLCCLISHGFAQDMSYKHSGLQNLFKRGTIVFYVNRDGKDSVITLSKGGAEKLYHDIRRAWTEARMG
jgi:hypothetical protein